MNPTILIVDDCADIARIVSHYLENASYRTVIAANGIEAWRMLEVLTPDCIVLDLMMPGMNGAEFLHGLRKNPTTSGIPVILMSARVGHYGTHFRSEMDADYSVGKPFTRSQIVEAVRTVLARQASSELDAPPPHPLPRVDAHAPMA